MPKKEEEEWGIGSLECMHGDPIVGKPVRIARAESDITSALKDSVGQQGEDSPGYVQNVSLILDLQSSSEYECIRVSGCGMYPDQGSRDRRRS